MRALTFFLISCLTLLQVSAQTGLTGKQWQEDLKFLQNTIHNDYPFLFKKTTAEAFDAEVEKLHNAIPNMQEHEIIIGLARIVSSFEYGHTALGFRYQPYAFHQFPFNLYQFNDGMYIQGVHKDYAQVLGAKVTHVAGVPIDDALKAVYPVVPVENKQYFKAFGINYLRIAEVLHAQGITSQLSKTVELTLEKDGKTFKQQFNAMEKGERVPTEYSLVKQDGDWLDVRDQNATPYYLKNLERIYYYEYLSEQKTVYVRHSQIQDDPQMDIPTFYAGVFDFIENNDVERLVIDVRLNGGGNNYKNKAVVTGIIATEKINQKGKLFVILGRRTFSACQNLVNELDTYTNAVFVGEPTAENINFYGDNRRVELPNSKIPAFLSFAWWQDKPQWENGPWLAPHVAVDMSFEEYRTNQDPVLDAALSFSDNDFILDPMQHLTDLFLSGKVEQVKQDALSMSKDPKYRFFDFEGQLNRAGYNVMSSGQYQEAIFVFQLITEMYPDSANAWDSLAESYLKAGQKDKAIEYYNKAIAMDPNGSVGDNARNMLKQIKE